MSCRNAPGDRLQAFQILGGQGGVQFVLQALDLLLASLAMLHQVHADLAQLIGRVAAPLAVLLAAGGYG